MPNHSIRAAVITTARHNIGDDFVREGIIYLLASIRSKIRFAFIHKHAPITAVYGLEAIRSPRFAKRLDVAARFLHLPDRIRYADLIIQSGAPVYWCHPGGPHCSDNEWFGPLIRERFLRDRRARKFFNIAGGSCQRFHSNGSELERCATCSPYIREFYDACNVTTLRDDLAHAMLRRAGRDARVLPCTSLFARDRFGLKPLTGEYIVLNFMENAGHYKFGQNIDSARWRAHFTQIAQEAAKYGRVVVACHNRTEDRLAQAVAPHCERFLVPNDHIEFMKFYSRANFGIVNRVHAAFMMASFGKPAVVIGNDSRALMVQSIGLPSIFVGDVEEVGVEPIVSAAAARASKGYPDEIEATRERTNRQYTEAFLSALDTH